MLDHREITLQCALRTHLHCKNGNVCLCVCVYCQSVVQSHVQKFFQVTTSVLTYSNIFPTQIRMILSISLMITLCHFLKLHMLISLTCRCEAGDLAGKFGTLSPNSDLNVLDTTGSLTLTGRYSIIGRSVVVHSNTDGTNFECGTIQLVQHQGDTGTCICYPTHPSL